VSEPDPLEATRREFEAVMRLPRFASIEQVAEDLGAVIDAGRTNRPRGAGFGPAPSAAGRAELPIRQKA
jgi:hypothetical protein